MRRLVEAAHLDETLATAQLVRRLSRAGLRVVAWTVNDAQRALALAELGVDWLITDRPGDLVAAFHGLPAREARPRS
jgi:glycerophosphoryl diester phosphodiesterase